MFDSLEEKIKHDASIQVSRGTRVIEVVAIIVLTVLLFGGLYFVVRVLE